MSTLSPYDLPDLVQEHFARWRRLQDERRFRVEQLASLDTELPSGQRHEGVKLALHIAATTALSDINAALARMDEGRYGLCVKCVQPIPADRLDVLPMASMCMPCHYNEQNCRLARNRP